MNECKLEYTSLKNTQLSKFEVANKHGTNRNQGGNLQNHASAYDYANVRNRRSDQVHEKRTQRATQFLENSPLSFHKSTTRQLDHLR